MKNMNESGAKDGNAAITGLAFLLTLSARQDDLPAWSASASMCITIAFAIENAGPGDDVQKPLAFPALYGLKRA